MMIIVWLGFVLGAFSAEGKVFQAKAGQKITLECGINSYPNNLEWHHRNQLIVRYFGKSGQSSNGQATIKARAKVKQTPNLEISGVNKEDSGKFTCVADGSRQEHMLLVVSVSASPPSAWVGGQVALNCEVGGLNQDSVQWNRPDGSLHEGSGKVQLNHVSLSDAGTWTCTFFYDSKKYSESLNIVVKAPTTTAPTSSPTQNSKVNSKKTCPNCGTGVGHLWWVWVVVGVGCLVVIVLTVLVIVLCKRIRRRKKMRQSLRPKQYCQCKRQTAAPKLQQGRQKGRPSVLPLQPLLTE
ncbi:T-cell surface glycoprotein CD4-like [Toxotes jaculatrix]|uniref:T-cell surface glycoprotein CD4-like n=1 Tax=Toxotes jaculatrix TaxID=941984 RepID=UPI001B3A8DBB|nr:T-cell surface glycoprotein CD4-like [Toxotes jaculatrix]